MRRRSFLSRLLALLAAVPLVGPLLLSSRSAEPERATFSYDATVADDVEAVAILERRRPGSEGWEEMHREELEDGGGSSEFKVWESPPPGETWDQRVRLERT